MMDYLTITGMLVAYRIIACVVLYLRTRSRGWSWYFINLKTNHAAIYYRPTAFC